MAVCPLCGEAFDSLDPGQLCPDCVPPPIPSVDESAPDDEGTVDEADDDPATEPRLGLAILSGHTRRSWGVCTLWYRNRVEDMPRRGRGALATAGEAPALLS